MSKRRKAGMTALVNGAAACVLGTMLTAGAAAAQSAAAPAQGMTADAKRGMRDGSRDFDPLIGTWKANLKRLLHPLSGDKTWIEFEGTQVTTSIWGGRGTMDEFVVHSDETNAHIEGLTIRLYNPESHQWSIYWANAKRAALDYPPMVGEWKDGRGEFYDQEVYDGRTIYVRYIWSNVTPTSGHFEQSFSADGGKTWEPNWISDIWRAPSAVGSKPAKP